MGIAVGSIEVPETEKAYDKRRQNGNKIELIFINVTSLQPDGQLQKQHNTETRIIKNNKQDMCETNKTTTTTTTTTTTSTTNNNNNNNNNGALEIIKNGLDQSLQLLPVHPSTTELQKNTLVSTTHVIRKVLPYIVLTSC